MFNKELYRKYFLSAFLGILIINLIITSMLYFFLIEKGKTDIYKNYMSSAQINFSETKTYLDSKVIHFKNIINSIDDSETFKSYLKTENKKQLVNVFEVLLKSNKSLFQIRYIDKKGLEKLRVDKDNTGNILENDALQDKSSRYYFIKTITLPKNSFYISDLDLNVEHGKIEKPYKPTIRVAKPIYRDNFLIGVLIINYNAQEILNTIKLKEFFNVFYMDINRNFFLHPNPEKNYSSQLGTNYKVKDEIPNIVSLIKTEGKLDKDSKYYLSKISITDNDFYIIYSLKEEIYNTLREEAQSEVLPIFIIVFFITLPLVLYGLNKQASQSVLLEAIIDNTPFPIFVKNIHGKIVLPNTSFLELTGYSSKDMIIGKKISDVLQKEEASKFEINLAMLQNSDVFRNEIEVYSSNGKRYFYDMKLIKLSLYGILNKVYFLGIAVDITEIKSINLQLKEMVDYEVKRRMELETTLMQQSKMAEMGNMLGNIIHQWKQPLNAISLLSSTGNYKIELDSNVDVQYLQDSFKQIGEQVDYMNETSNDFRDFFSPNKQKEDFKVIDIIAKIERILKHRIKSINVNIEKNIDIDLTLNGYINELGQVILSIFNNAFDKFTPDSIKPTIKISIFEENGKVFIQLADNGGDIPDELLPDKLFTQYFTTKSDGTGLGLSICKKIIEVNFYGKIKAYNKEGYATFEISIPNINSDKGLNN